MKKNVIAFFSALVIGTSFLGGIAANATTVPTDKPNATIEPAWVSKHQPKTGYSGPLWCTGYKVRYYINNNYNEVAGTFDVGEEIDCTGVSNGYAYFRDDVNMYKVSVKYMTTDPDEA